MMSTSIPCRICNLGDALPHASDVVGLPCDAIVRERARRTRARGVVGDRDVLVLQRPGRKHHGVDRIAPVAPDRVRMQVAADVGHLDQRVARRVVVEVVRAAMASLGFDVGSVEHPVHVALVGERERDA